VVVRKAVVTGMVQCGAVDVRYRFLTARLGNALILQSRVRKEAVTSRVGSDLKR
jgi:hypothetical protein